MLIKSAASSLGSLGRLAKTKQENYLSDKEAGVSGSPCRPAMGWGVCSAGQDCEHSRRRGESRLEWSPRVLAGWGPGRRWSRTSRWGRGCGAEQLKGGSAGNPWGARHLLRPLELRAKDDGESKVHLTVLVLTHLTSGNPPKWWGGSGHPFQVGALAPGLYSSWERTAAGSPPPCHSGSQWVPQEP